MELLQHLQGDATTIVEKERKLSEMILQLQLFREQLLTQQDHSNKVIFLSHLFQWGSGYTFELKLRLLKNCGI